MPSVPNMERAEMSPLATVRHLLNADASDQIPLHKDTLRALMECAYALADLNRSDILGVAESCASGTLRWEMVHERIERARTAITKCTNS